MSNRRDRARKPARRKPYRQPKPVILIVTEGEVTEPEYFAGLSRSVRNPRVRIDIHGEHGVPMTLVDAAREIQKRNRRDAKAQKDANLLFDQIWCVFDIDDHPDIPKARQTARDNGIELAISNPSFELWLLLHFRDNPGMKNRKKIAELVNKHMPGYDKSVDFPRYAEGRLVAEKRAERLENDAIADGDEGRNPTTGVYHLSRVIAETA